MNFFDKRKSLVKRLAQCGFALLGSLGVSQAYAELPDGLTFSGFGRITAGYLDTDQANFKGYSNSLSAKPESLIGLQASYEFNSVLSATMQGILRADEDANDSVLNWAYLTWQPDDNLMVKLGRLRTPFFALSDVVDVGYSYPWVTAPQQVYDAILFPTFDGIDLAWGHSTEYFDTSLETYIGQYDGTMELGGYQTDYSVEVFGGLIAKINYNNFEFRASHHRGQVDIAFDNIDQLKASLASFPQSLNFVQNKGWFNVEELSISYDNLDYFSRAEWVLINPEISVAPDIESYYLTAGYNFFPFTVHLTYAQSVFDYQTIPNEIPYGVSDQLNLLYQYWQGVTSVLSNDSLRSWTLGARWDLMPKVALKAEVTLLDGDSDKNSFFDSIQEGFDRDASLYKLSVEWVF